MTDHMKSIIRAEIIILEARAEVLVCYERYKLEVRVINGQIKKLKEKLGE